MAGAGDASSVTDAQIGELRTHLTELAQRATEQRLPPEAAWDQVDTAARAFIARFPGRGLRWGIRGTRGRMEDRDRVVLAIEIDWGTVRIAGAGAE
jgi:hypothetical protein